LTGRAAAVYLSISSAHVSDLEKDKANPSLDLLARLADYYRTTTDYLLGRTDDQAPRRDEPLPDLVREIVELLLGMAPQRQQDVLAVVQTLMALDERKADHLQAYDRMMELIEKAGGEDAVEALETALRAGAAGDTPAALRLIEAFFAGRDAKETLEEERNEV
jgi:transcriptional regulator with XRE-family HTH domain